MSIGEWRLYADLFALSSIVLFLLFVRTYYRIKTRSREEKAERTEILPQLYRGGAVRVRIRAGFDAADARARIRDAWGRDRKIEDSDATVVDVVGDVRETLANIRPTWVPVAAWRGGLQAIALFLAGLLAVAPITVWRLLVDPSPFGAGDAVGVGLAAVSLLETAVLAFPYAATVLGLVLATGVLSVQLVWGTWVVPSVALLAGAVALAHLHRRINEADAVPSDVRLHDGPGWTLLTILARTVAIWTVGVAIAAPFRLVGRFESAGELVGLLAAVAVGVWFLTHTGRTIARRLRAIGEIHHAETATVVAYLVLRPVYISLAALGAGLTVAYLAYSVTSGRLADVAGVVAGAPIWVQVSLLGGVASVVALVALQVPGIRENLRDVAARLSRSTALRLWIFARGVPIVGIISAFAFVLALFASVWYAAGAAIVVGVVLRLAGGLVTRSKYAALRRYDGRDSSVAEVHVSPFDVQDSDGETIHVADVDGVRLMHRDRGLLLDDVVETARTRTETGGLPTTEASYYADAVESGRVSLRDTRAKLEGDAKTRVRHTVQESGGRHPADRVRELANRDLPTWVVDDAIRDLRQQNVLDRRDGDLVLIRSDTSLA